MLVATRDLLTSLDPMPYRQRMKNLAAWARVAPERAEVRTRLAIDVPRARGYRSPGTV